MPTRQNTEMVIVSLHDLEQIIERIVEEKNRRLAEDVLAKAEAMLRTPEYANSLTELSQILGVSRSTVQRWRDDGLLDDAMCQRGRTIMTNVAKVRESLLLKHQRKH